MLTQTQHNAASVPIRSTKEKREEVVEGETSFYTYQARAPRRWINNPRDTKTDPASVRLPRMRDFRVYSGCWTGVLERSGGLGGGSGGNVVRVKACCMDSSIVPKSHTTGLSKMSIIL